LGAKIQGQEGNSPDFMLKFLKLYLVLKIRISQEQPNGRLGSSHPLKKASQHIGQMGLFVLII